MNPGEGSGSKQGGLKPEVGPSQSENPVELTFEQLKEQIVPLLEVFGNKKPLHDIVARQLKTQAQEQKITIVKEQYDNLFYAYNEELKGYNKNFALFNREIASNTLHISNQPIKNEDEENQEPVQSFPNAKKQYEILVYSYNHSLAIYAGFSKKLKHSLDVKIQHRNNPKPVQLISQMIDQLNELFRINDDILTRLTVDNHTIMPKNFTSRLKQLQRKLQEKVGSSNVNDGNVDVVAGAGHHGSGPETEMKICNFLLLNFCLLHLFPLLLGMHPGEGSASHPGGMNQGAGPIGSLQPINSHPGGMNQGEGPRVMYQGEGSGTQQPVDEFTQLKGLIFPLLERVGNQEILQEIVPRPLRGPIRENIANNNPNFTQKQHEEAIKNMNELESYHQINETLKNGLTADMRALYDYVQIIYNQTIQNLGEGPSGSQTGGMNLGEGSGSQLPADMKQLDLKIRHMLHYVGSSAPLPGIIKRLLKNQRNTQEINNIEKQYNNLIFAYHELYDEFTGISQLIQNYESDDPTILHQINELNTRLQNIENEKTKIIEDMVKIDKYLNEVPPVSHKQNRRTRGQGTSGQGTRGERTQGPHSGGHGTGSGN
uniref:Uncharacterized protein n=1 Tax=Meloidogyne javanica TaxID=6303 RepID=A0A915M6H1_MELJA